MHSLLCGLKSGFWPVWGSLLCFAGILSAESVDKVISSDGIVFTNQVNSKVPWSINIVKVPIGTTKYEMQSMHSGGGVLGLAPLSTVIDLIQPGLGKPIAAINGDFYIREKSYAGAPRGAQIVNGEMIRCPAGGATFWVDVMGKPHLESVTSRFQVTWPDGSVVSCGLNEVRQPEKVVLYTPTLGDSTKTEGGRELYLEREGKSPWLPLKAGKSYTARVREVKETGDSPLVPDELILSISPETAKTIPVVQPGAVIHFTTESSPSMRGSKTALGGGPMLVHQGRRQKISRDGAGTYESDSMFERHPRSAIGWNKDYYFLVVVDGRQKNLSVGMTLEELSACMSDLECEEALNLDGGGSSTLWYDGKVVNSPCDGVERNVANAIVVVQKPPRSLETAHPKENPTSQ